jgi:hypothetical protein
MIKSRDSTLHVTGRRRLSLRLHRQIADNVNPFSRGNVFKSDLGPAHGMHQSDDGTIEFRNASARSAEKNVCQGITLSTVSAIIDVEDDFPPGTGLDVVEISDRKHRTQARQIDSIGMAQLDEPRQRTKTHPIG